MSVLLAKNLEALGTRHRELARRIESCAETLTVDARPATSGAVVPVVTYGGRARPLHSLEDPAREGRRLCASVLESPPGEGPPQRRSAGQGPGREPLYLAIAGLAGGYHVAPLLASGRVERILILERDLALLRALLSVVDLAETFRDPRVALLVDAKPAELRAHILRDYLPALHGGFRYLRLRSRIDLDRPYFSELEGALKQAAEEVSNDFAAQAAFGLRWFRNIAGNLPLLPQGERRLPRIREALVVGAGPSLEASRTELEELAGGIPILATDTSLPVLLERGIVPRYVLTIDCQQLGYHHYLSGLPAETTLVADLAAPPQVTRLSEGRLFVVGGHPFGAYIGRRLRSLLPIDSTGGNVGYAATSFAITLGARRVHLFGLDFSYPGGSTYARGSYLAPLFLSRQTRLVPLEARDTALFLGDASLRRESEGELYRYTTGRLTGYRVRFEATFAALGVEIVRHGGRVRSSIRQAGRGSNQSGENSDPGDLLIPAAHADDIERVLVEYRAGIRKLGSRPRSSLPAEAFLASLGADELEVLVTLLPLLAFVRGSGFGGEMSFGAALQEGLRIVDDRLSR